MEEGFIGMLDIVKVNRKDLRFWMKGKLLKGLVKMVMRLFTWMRIGKGKYTCYIKIDHYQGD